jgi:hypothetical protein
MGMGPIIRNKEGRMSTEIMMRKLNHIQQGPNSGLLVLGSQSE